MVSVTVSSVPSASAAASTSTHWRWFQFPGVNANVAPDARSSPPGPVTVRSVPCIPDTRTGTGTSPVGFTVRLTP